MSAPATLPPPTPLRAPRMPRPYQLSLIARDHTQLRDPVARAILRIICDHATIGTRTAIISQRRLALLAGTSKSTVVRKIDLITEAGEATYTTERVPGGNYSTTRWTIFVHCPRDCHDGSHRPRGGEDT